jgi:RHS repeat-associated protein
MRTPPYSAWGLRTTAQGYGATDMNRQKYGLTERDDATGLDHTWFRKYENLSGRWTSPDPLGGGISDPQSFNHYAYAGNDPVNFVDPSGLEKCWDGHQWVDCDPGHATTSTWAPLWDWGPWNSMLFGHYGAISEFERTWRIQEPPQKPARKQKEPCDRSPAAIRQGAKQVAKTVPGARVGVQNNQTVIRFAGGYDQTVSQLTKAGYYSGIFAYNPWNHFGGKEFRTSGEPGFHFKVVYPTVQIIATPGEPGYATVNGTEPAVATDLHIDCDNPVGQGLGAKIRHFDDFFRSNTPWWLPLILGAH